MKKLFAIAIAAIMTIALCVSVSAVGNLDGMCVNGYTLGDMFANNKNNDSTVAITEGDKIYILGWCVDTTTPTKLKEVVYLLDGVEKKIDEAPSPRPDLHAALGLSDDFAVINECAGFGTNEKGMELTGIDKLKSGSYTVKIIGKYENGTTDVIKNDFTLVVAPGAGEEEPDDPNAVSNPTTCLDALSVNYYSIGDMLEHNKNNDGTISIAKGDMIYILGWAVDTGKVNKLKEVVYVIDGTEKKCADSVAARSDLHKALQLSDKFAVINDTAGFGTNDKGMDLTGIDKLGDGTYTVKILAKYENGAEGVIKDDFTLIVGTGEKDPAQQGNDDDTPSTPSDNPNTADAAVIAIAVVACVALAGVVVAKKIK